MNALLRTPQRKSSPQFRPSLEALEARDCPACYWPRPIITLNVQYSNQNNVVLSGRVMDPNGAGGLTVILGGAYVGTCVTNADGTYSKTIATSALGTESAVTKDSLQMVSNIALAQISNSAPQIVDFQASHLSDNIWVFTGRVIDESPANLTVYLNGM